MRTGHRSFDTSTRLSAGKLSASRTGPSTALGIKFIKGEFFFHQASLILLKFF